MAIESFKDIPTSITISMGLKNRIRERKGERTYEEFLTQLLEEKQQDIPRNRIELTQFNRKTFVTDWKDQRIQVKYNELIPSPSHRFDIQIVRTLREGKPLRPEDIRETVQESYERYFTILQKVISKEKKMRFTHKGRIEDADRWKEEFRRVGLSRIAYEDDVAEKLQEYEQGIPFT